MKGKVFLQVKERSGRLEQVFVIPPISVFDVKSGRWKNDNEDAMKIIRSGIDAAKNNKKNILKKMLDNASQYDLGPALIHKLPR